MTSLDNASLKYPANSGAGAALHGGLWNSPGVEIVCTAESIALAVLEIVVNFSVLPKDFGLTRISIPEDIQMAETFAVVERLPLGWDDPLPARETQEIGSRWVEHNADAVFVVPSAIIRFELNYLLNPKHPDFQKIGFDAPLPFHFDPRLFK